MAIALHSVASVIHRGIRATVESGISQCTKSRPIRVM